MSTVEIERVDAHTAPAEIATRFVDPAIPVIVEGAGRGMPGFGRVDRAYLEAKLGRVEIGWKTSSSHVHPDFRARTIPEMFARGTGTLAELLERITEGPPGERARRIFTGDERFLLRRREGEVTVDPELAPLLDEVTLPSFVPEDRLYTAWGWLSGAGVRTWLHYDNNGCHNANVQLTGEKSCELFAPDDLAAMAPFLLGGGNPATNCSRIDVERVDAAFASFGSARRWRGTLRAGDVLFIPAWWWHTFRHGGALNVNVNFWWKPVRPLPSATAERQAFLDAAARVKPEGAEASALLRRLDEALVAGPRSGA